MRHHWIGFTLAIFSCAAAAAEDYKVAPVEGPPAGLSEKVTAALDPAGQRVSGPTGAYLDVWLAKELAVKEGFQPTLNVKYPFTSGQFVGAIRIPEGVEFKDFRGQQVQPGTYTLRYGRQPEDGNHIGTSDLYDFLLALPAAADQDPALIEDFDSLTATSAKSAEASHPAILSLLPPEANDKAPAVIHLADREFQVLSLSGKAAENKPLPLRVVVVGQSEI